MPEFYTDDRRSLHFEAPQFNRANHRYRGPRESEKINLEIDQLAYSIYNLYNRYRIINENLHENIEALSSGGPIEEVEDVDLAGSSPLASKINKLRNRVRALEENRD